MDDTGILGSALGQLGKTAKQTVKQVVKLPGEMAKDAGEQIGGVKSGGNETQGNKTQKQWQSDEERVNFLKGLYGSTEQVSSTKQNPLEAVKGDSQVKSGKPTEFQEQIKNKSPEEQEKLMALRNQLHKDYVDSTFNPVKNPSDKEERPAEKVENEKNKEMQDLQKKEAEKPHPIAVVREQNKAEMFRGAAG